MAVRPLVGYATRDLVIPAGGWSSIAKANMAATAWRLEVNGRVHGETMAIPAERLVTERALLRSLPSSAHRCGAGKGARWTGSERCASKSVRYSAPARLVGMSVEVVAHEGTVVISYEDAEVARHRVVAPGEVALDDEHYGGKVVRPTRAIRPRRTSEIAFLALGGSAEAFLRAAAAAGTARLAGELVEIVVLEAAWGREALRRAVERAEAFRRFKAADVRTILLAGDGVPTVTRPGADLLLDLPTAPTRDLEAYALAAIRCVQPPPSWLPIW